jgi:hypothetical protein
VFEQISASILQRLDLLGIRLSQNKRFLLFFRNVAEARFRLFAVENFSNSIQSC